MSQYDYKFSEFDDLTKRIDSVTDEVYRHKKGDATVPADQLKEKLGNKLDMTNLIIRLTKVCTESRKLLSQLHSHNFELRGKLADVSSEALSKITKDAHAQHAKLREEIDLLPGKIGRLQTEQKSNLAKVQEQTYASIAGDSKSLVTPIKRAMKELKEDDKRSRNVIVHGLDIDPSKTQSSKEKRANLKMLARSVLMETTSAEPEDLPGVENMVILGKVADSGKAPPVLVKLNNDKEVSHILKGAKNLAKYQALRKVFISVDLGVEQREERRALMLKLKEKIRDFPEEHWVVRDGMVTSKGKYTPSQHVVDKGNALKSYEH